MSNHSHLIGRKRTARKAHPSDRFTKVELWDRLQAAQRALELAGNAAEDARKRARWASATSDTETTRRLRGIEASSTTARNHARSHLPCPKCGGSDLLTTADEQRASRVQLDQPTEPT